jgi:hypothetical protein
MNLDMNTKYKNIDSQVLSSLFVTQDDDTKDYDAFIANLLKGVELHDLSNNISLNKMSSALVVPETNQSIFSKYEILIENLNVDISCREEIVIDSFSDSTINARGYASTFGVAIGNVIIKFENVNFFNSSKEVRGNDLLLKFSHSHVQFKSCRVEGLPVCIEASGSYLYFELNEFDGSFVTYILGDNDRGMESFLKLYSNHFHGLDIVGGSTSIVGKNKIYYLSERSTTPIYFGSYNTLDPLGVNSVKNRVVVGRWLKEAKDNGDKKQELILNRELLKIEISVIDEESGNRPHLFNHTFKDWFLLHFGRVTNDFRMDWLRPLLLILLIELSFCAILLKTFNYTMCYEWSCVFDTFGMYVNLLNPTKSVKGVLSIESINQGWEALNLIKNIVVSILAFQLVGAFRRYSTK